MALLKSTTVQKLLKLYLGEMLPGTELKNEHLKLLLDEKLLTLIKASTGRKGKIYLLPSKKEAFVQYLNSQYGILDIEGYALLHENKNADRSDALQVSNNSKAKKKATFSGFMLKAYQEIPMIYKGNKELFIPQEGCYTFRHDWEDYIPEPHVTIVGMENVENFEKISYQKYLFEGITPLFVSRYPQSQTKAMRKWLRKIPNPYLHFGDFDISGIGIYLNEYKRYLGDKARFFIPDNIEEYFKYGNRDLFNRQKVNFDINDVQEEKIKYLLNLIYQYQAGVEQEIFIQK
ncbi:hypothetical protein [Elizabethkingia sp. JS20170427COW]|uniref:DUF7281 domain-containing protein n=1 Tax=Elizabethkingia sp. JS20170427COW TaxID=2583851 RepID=UPI0011101B83|nr:hypothetical protein [Elizabethkingia sp. JS20170427COW]QCX52394.1 hypothetical protein FGE20_00830 [Elizabethkingia sp. JS20170427COW]